MEPSTSKEAGEQTHAQVVNGNQTHSQENQSSHLDPPPDYPKIPLPPNEHPPPYTPFGGQTATLLPQNNYNQNHPLRQQTSTTQNRNPHVINPSGFRRYLQYMTTRNILIVLGCLAALVLFVKFIHWANMIDLMNGDDNVRAQFGHNARGVGGSGARELDFARLNLGVYNKTLEHMSYDETTDTIILSQYYPEKNLLYCEVVNVNNLRAGFRNFTYTMERRFAECTCFTERVMCCVTSADSRHHQTECFLNGSGNGRIHSVAVMFDFSMNWQSLTDDEFLLILHNRQRNSILDLKNKKILKIEENHLPSKHFSIGFFFPMDNAEELDELVRSGDEFRICEYLRTNTAQYALKNEHCTQTPFKVEFELPKVKFCSNPLYTAIVQYGHLPGDIQTLTWHLRVKYDSSPQIYSATESFEAPRDELVLDCNDREVDLFALGPHQVHQYTITLPDLRSEHYIQTRAT